MWHAPCAVTAIVPAVGGAYGGEAER
ncbi:predicted protein [Streptomyces iranensis]|uniref:Uncharacterized protein n=1 Tax=Streptomyces iranensis TaxID=576784 RepID=A0A061A8J5_9ACTN|nr:predicted protein [Streptomyces iranensis]